MSKLIIFDQDRSHNIWIPVTYKYHNNVYYVRFGIYDRNICYFFDVDLHRNIYELNNFVNDTDQPLYTDYSRVKCLAEKIEYKNNEIIDDARVYSSESSENNSSISGESLYKGDTSSSMPLFDMESSDNFPRYIKFLELVGDKKYVKFYHKNDTYNYLLKEKDDTIIITEEYFDELEKF
ncbi:uncharacterized protein VNE69_11086 [Vairimorpha necatrix]|uniref:Uncharacterized protein n=1 Tax=Vairimorpha necatrix TaxID=6039 RepID=A0AAX4JFW4_9MICR